MQKRTLGVMIALLGLLVVVSAGVVAGELHVPGDYETIQAAVDAAVEGDVIVIAPGRYIETVVLRDKSNLTIRADVAMPEDLEGWRRANAIAGMVIIAGEMRLLGTNTDILIEGLTITGVGHGILLHGDNSGITIRYCIIVRNIQSGIVLRHVYRDVVIEYSNVSDNSADGIDLAGHGRDIQIRNSNISDNGSVGIRVGAFNFRVRIARNVIRGNFFAGIHPS